MKLKYLIILFVLFIFSCTSIDDSYNKKIEEKIYYSSSGFALIYETSLFDNKVITKKLNNSVISISHRTLKKNTLVKITNPNNSKFIISKFQKNQNFQKFLILRLVKKLQIF